MKKLGLIILMSLCVCLANAQAVDHYECDFEDATECSKWVLNSVAIPERIVYNQWHIGQSGQFGPDTTHFHGLFITCDTLLGDNGRALYAKKPVRGGARTGYYDGGIVTTAYRELTLEAGTYLLSFDWICNGKGSSEDGFTVAWVPATQNTYSADRQSSLPDYADPKNRSWLLNNAIEPKCHHYEEYWWNYDNIIFTTNGTPGKLVFLWFNAEGSSESGKLEPNPPSACVDNIVISPVHQTDTHIDTCMLPTHLSRTCIEGEKAIIRWSGNSDYYDLRWYNPQDSSWQLISNIKDTFYTIDKYSEGVQCVYIQGHCIIDGEEYKSGYTHWRPFMFYKGERCVDYMDLTDENCATTSMSSLGQIQTKWHDGLVDMGWENDSSRHTLFYMPKEYDPVGYDYENNAFLLTKPVDALTSVRLGNRYTGFDSYNGGGERIEYSFMVDSTFSILRLQYAIVMEDRSSHTIELQPHFRLEVLHNGILEDPECDVVDYAAGYAADADEGFWHSYFEKWNSQESQSDPVYVWWRDWDDAYVNLTAYKGDIITIRLSTTDCMEGGHYGYAYFVIDCLPGDFTGNSCNSEKPNINTFTAPKGFSYRWYLKSDAEVPLEDRNILSDSIAYDIPFLDPNIYCVDLVSLQKPNCYHTYELCGLPQIPVSRINWNQVRPCENTIILSDSSYLYRLFGDSIVPLLEGDRLYSCTIDYGDGSPIEEILGKDSVIHEYPASGEYKAIVTASASNIPECPNEDKLEIPITVQIKQVGPFYISVGDQCPGYEYWGTFNVPDTMYVMQTDSDAEACQYDVDVHVYEKYFPVDTTICEGSSITFRDPVSGMSYTKSEPSGTEPYQLVFKKHAQHCEALDSILLLTLRQITLPALDMRDTVVACADAFSTIIDCGIKKGEEALSDVTILMSQEAQNAGFDATYTFTKDDVLSGSLSIPLPNGVQPGYYWATIDISTASCDVPMTKVCFQVNYPSSLVGEVSGKTNGFLSVVNSDRFDDKFVNYAWYRNGELIYEGTEAYVGISRADDFGSSYQVVITRSDGLVLPACAYIIGGGTDLEENNGSQIVVNPTLVAPGDKVLLSKTVDAQIYTVLGACVASYKQIESLTAPAIPGIYYIMLNNEQIVKICVE